MSRVRLSEWVPHSMHCQLVKPQLVLHTNTFIDSLHSNWLWCSHKYWGVLIPLTLSVIFFEELSLSRSLSESHPLGRRRTFTQSAIRLVLRRERRHRYTSSPTISPFSSFLFNLIQFPPFSPVQAENPSILLAYLIHFALGERFPNRIHLPWGERLSWRENSYRA